MNEHLIIFVKNPELGKVKTRLAAAIGDEQALKIYRKLLQITHDQTLPIQGLKHVCYTDHVDENDIWEAKEYKKHVQGNGDLGEKMLGALQGVFDRGAEKMVIIGSDCPQLTTEHLETAFEKLDKYDLVIGPAKDGGYYLIGMKVPLPMLFKNKEWSTDSVFADTILDVMDMGLSYFRLPELSDVDTIYDLGLME